MTGPLVTAALVMTVGLGLVAVVSWDYLVSILSLSGASIALAVYFYLAGAPIAAVFEAVVAAGLVTVLFLFVVSLTETEADATEHLVGTKRAIVGVALAAMGGVAVAVWTLLEATGGAPSDVPFAEALWSGRSVDLLAVTILIFVGVLAVARLTADRLDIELDRPDETTTEVES